MPHNFFLSFPPSSTRLSTHLSLPARHLELDSKSSPEAQPKRHSSSPAVSSPLLTFCSPWTAPRCRPLHGWESQNSARTRSCPPERTSWQYAGCADSPHTVNHQQNLPFSPPTQASSQSRCWLPPLRMTDCTSLFTGLCASTIRPLQLTQDIAAPLMCNLPRLSHGRSC